MPCMGPSPQEELNAATHTIHQLTRMLCSLCRRVDEYEEPEMPHNVRVWWDTHKAEDERVQAEAKAEADKLRKKRRLRKSAAAKLSPEERKVLGIE